VLKKNCLFIYIILGRGLRKLAISNAFPMSRLATRTVVSGRGYDTLKKSEEGMAWGGRSGERNRGEEVGRGIEENNGNTLV
jgi:hypothetical protein